MQFRDLKKQYNILQNEIDSNIKEVCKCANFIMGPQVIELEKQLADYVGVKHCVTVGNGTDALFMALMALDIKKGDAVFVPDFTFFASGEVVTFIGATPIFYDVCEDTFNADAVSLENAIVAVENEGKLNPKAIITVDLFGLPADYEKIRRIANKYGMLLLEDGAQGFGGEINGERACAFGDISTTSFFPAKPLGCFGDGGAIFTDNEEWYHYLTSIRVHGKGTMKYDNVRIGVNSRLDTIQAAVLLPKLKAFIEYERDCVINVANGYSDRFEKSLIPIKYPKISEGYISSWAQYTILLKNEVVRNGLQSFLKEKGIPTMIYYPIVMSEQRAFDDGQKHVYTNNVVAKDLSKRVLSIPIHPYMDSEEIDTVVKEIIDYFEE